MTKVTLGKVDFTAKRLSHGRRIGGKFDPYFADGLDLITMTKSMKFHCDGPLRKPDPFPTAFEMVEPHLMVYFNDPYLPKDHAAIDRASERYGASLLRQTGHAGGWEVERDINKAFGVHDIPFDVDAAIASLTAFRLNIRVTLHYEHYRLKFDGMSRFARVILSLPHTVLISAERTHICHPGGVVKLPKIGRYFRTVNRTYVRAKTRDAFDLRGAAQRRWIEDRKKYIKKAQDAIKTSERELDEMRPEGD